MEAGDFYPWEKWLCPEAGSSSPSSTYLIAELTLRFYLTQIEDV
jgi:hypothetical protein